MLICCRHHKWPLYRLWHEGGIHKTRRVISFSSSQGEETEDAVTHTQYFVLETFPSYESNTKPFEDWNTVLRPDHEVIIMNIASCFWEGLVQSRFQQFYVTEPVPETKNCRRPELHLVTLFQYRVFHREKNLQCKWMRLLEGDLNCISTATGLHSVDLKTILQFTTAGQVCLQSPASDWSKQIRSDRKCMVPFTQISACLSSDLRH